MLADCPPKSSLLTQAFAVNIFLMPADYPMRLSPERFRGSCAPVGGCGVAECEDLVPWSTRLHKPPGIRGRGCRGGRTAASGNELEAERARVGKKRREELENGRAIMKNTSRESQAESSGRGLRFLGRAASHFPVSPLYRDSPMVGLSRELSPTVSVLSCQKAAGNFLPRTGVAELPLLCLDRGGSHATLSSEAVGRDGRRRASIEI